MPALHVVHDKRATCVQIPKAAQSLTIGFMGDAQVDADRWQRIGTFLGSENRESNSVWAFVVVADQPHPMQHDQTGLVGRNMQGSSAMTEYLFCSEFCDFGFGVAVARWVSGNIYFREVSRYFG